MAVRQRGNGYQADVSEKLGDGRTKRHRYLFKTQAEATGWEADAMAALANGRPVPEPSAATHGAKPGSILFERASETFLADEYGHSTDSAWPRTVKLHLKSMRKFFGTHATVAEIATPEELSRYTAHLYDICNSQSTVNAKLSILSKFFDWAIERRYITTKPKVKRRQPNNEREGYISEEEERTILRLLIQWEKHDEADACVVLIDLGLRGSELWRLTGKDITDRGTARPMPVMVGAQRKTKNGTTRIVYATQRARSILVRRKEVYGEGRLFPTLDNFKLLRAWNRVKDTMKKTDDENFVPYLMRHTYGSRSAQAGVPIGVLQKLMGHKTITQTMRYAKYAPTNFEDAAVALDKFKVAEIVQFPSKDAAQ